MDKQHQIPKYVEVANGYQLIEDYHDDPTGLLLPVTSRCGYIHLIRGRGDIPDSITLKKGFVWDGASGPTIDDSTNARAAMIHDALYRTVRAGILDKWYRATADQVFYTALREDGMAWWRAFYYWLGVRLFGWRSVRPK